MRSERESETPEALRETPGGHGTSTGWNYLLARRQFVGSELKFIVLVSSLYLPPPFCVPDLHPICSDISKKADLLPSRLPEQEDKGKGYPRVSQSCTEAT